MNNIITEEQMQDVLLKAFTLAKKQNNLNNILIYVTGLLNNLYYKNQMSLASFMQCSQSTICRRKQKYDELLESLIESHHEFPEDA